MDALCCDCDAFVLDLHALHEDSSDGKIQCPTVDVVLCENCAMGEGCVLEVA